MTVIDKDLYELLINFDDITDEDVDKVKIYLSNIVNFNIQKMQVCRQSTMVWIVCFYDNDFNEFPVKFAFNTKKNYILYEQSLDYLLDDNLWLVF